MPAKMLDWLLAPSLLSAMSTLTRHCVSHRGLAAPSSTPRSPTGCTKPSRNTL